MDFPKWVLGIPAEDWNDIEEYRAWKRQEMSNWKKMCPVAVDGLERMGF